VVDYVSVTGSGLILNPRYFGDVREAAAFVSGNKQCLSRMKQQLTIFDFNLI
jgi:hypothetical protein